MFAVNVYVEAGSAAEDAPHDGICDGMYYCIRKNADDRGLLRERSHLPRSNPDDLIGRREKAESAL